MPLSTAMIKYVPMADVSIIGGGLSGCEAALQAAKRGFNIDLFEMRPEKQTGAHQTGLLAEFVCSNSIGSQLPDRPSGLLMVELEKLGSHLLRIARECSVPAGHALAIDRHAFATEVTREISENPKINLIRKEVTSIPRGKVIIASGPLTSKQLSEHLQSVTGLDNLFFFDAVAPIIQFESINMEVAFWGSRYGRGQSVPGDYINCPFDKEQYETFNDCLASANRVQLKSFESEINSGVTAGKPSFFEGCLPVEVMAQRGPRTLAFGPLRPVGLTNPHKPDKPYAVVQLRQDDRSGETYNLVGFQTNLTISEQKRVFRMIPGLEKAEFVRFGQMHRNTFIASPVLLNESFQLRTNLDVFFCGQITGVEGYLSNIASGLLTGINAVRYFRGEDQILFPKTTIIGALFDFIIQTSLDDFQPMKPNFGLLPPLDQPIRPKKVRFEAYSLRAQKDLDSYLDSHEI